MENRGGRGWPGTEGREGPLRPSQAAERPAGTPLGEWEVRRGKLESGEHKGVNQKVCWEQEVLGNGVGES